MVLYSLYLFGTHLHHMYNVAEFSKSVYTSSRHIFTPNKVIYTIQDEIWEIVTHEETLPFHDYICVN